MQMSKFQRSWLLFKSSVVIVSRNKKLLVFPVLTAVLISFILLFFFLAPAALQRTGYGIGQLDHWKAVGKTLFTTEATTGGTSESFRLKPLGLAYAAFLYFLAMLLATFFNVAFYHEILSALKGGAVSVQGGFAFACGRWRSILMWTLFAGLVGLIIRTLEEKLDFIGQIILGLIGTAWSVASVFVIPLIVTQQSSLNPIATLKQSALTLKKTWGESLIGYVGLQFGTLLVLFGSLIYLGGAIALAVALDNYWLLGIAGCLWLCGMVVFAYLTSVAGQVYQCALFLYA